MVWNIDFHCGIVRKEFHPVSFPVFGQTQHKRKDPVLGFLQLNRVRKYGQLA